MAGIVAGAAPSPVAGLLLSLRRCRLSYFLPHLSPSHSRRPLTAVSGAAEGGDGDRFVALSSSELRRRRTNTDGGDGDAKLAALRALFTRPDVAVDAYVVPSQDAHQSEFIAECFARRAWLTGFTGSAGTAVVTKDKAALWTDGRYFLQAEKELSSDWMLMRSGNYGVPTPGEWLNDELPPGGRVGIDPFLFSYDAAEDLKEAISKKNHELVLVKSYNLVDEIWKNSKPKLPAGVARVHDIRHAGIDVSAKLSFLRSELADNGCTATVISTLDEVAWLLNLRGNDAPHSPVFYSYLVVEINRATLFISSNKVTDEVQNHLRKAGVGIKPYESILSEIERLGKTGGKLWLDPSTVNTAIVSVFKASCGRSASSSGSYKGKQGDLKKESHGLYKASPVTLAKAVKNKAEIEGMKNAHLRDAAALSEFWYWMEEAMTSNVALTEVEVSVKLLEFRKKQEGFIETSFETISGYGSNGAIIHYRPTPECCSSVGRDNLFLLDSGGQYVDGTTDITRTVHFGEPSSRQKECFTRVLQGHIALDQAIFPERTPGFVLDVLARSSLWKIGLDYRHGTGHGVGAALNVHEGPQSISFRYGNMTALQKGMIVSNEPGYYEDNMFGIRIENLMLVKEADVPNSFGGIAYLGFEKLTFVPIQSKLIELSLLSSSEIKWLDDYHSQVWEKISPLLSGDALAWLWRNTRPLVVD